MRSGSCFISISQPIAAPGLAAWNWPATQFFERPKSAKGSLNTITEDLLRRPLLGDHAIVERSDLIGDLAGKLHLVRASVPAANTLIDAPAIQSRNIAVLA